MQLRYSSRQNRSWLKLPELTTLEAIIIAHYAFISAILFSKTKGNTVTIFERFQSPLILAAVALGLFLGQFHRVSVNAASFITPLLMVMLFGVFIQIPLHHLRRALKDFKFAGLNLVL